MKKYVNSYLKFKTYNSIRYVNKMSLNLYKNFPKELIIIILNFDGRIKERKGKFVDQINTNDKKYYLVINNLLNNAILQNKLQLHLTNYEHNYKPNYALYDIFNGDRLLNKTICQWLSIREVRHVIYMIDINPPNTRYNTRLGSWFNVVGLQYSN